MTFSNPDFDARIARIASGQGSSKATLYVGLDEIYQVSYPNRGKSVAPTAASSGVLYPVALLLALCTGLLSFGFAAWLRFQSMGIGTGSGNVRTEMAIQLGSAAAVGLVLAMILGLRSRQMIVVMAVGIFAATTLHHNAVHLYPEAFAQVFSPDWVEVVRAGTSPNSVLWMGQSFRF